VVAKPGVVAVVAAMEDAPRPEVAVVAKPDAAAAVEAAEEAAIADAPRPEAAAVVGVARPGVAEVEAGAEAMVAQDASRPAAEVAVAEVAAMEDARQPEAVAANPGVAAVAKPGAQPKAAVAATASFPSAAREASSRRARDRDGQEAAPLSQTLSCRPAAASLAEAEAMAVAPAAPRRPVSCGASYCSG
jgi:translation initiation factor IF-2